MTLWQNFCEYLSHITYLDQKLISLILMSIFIISVFYLIKTIGSKLIQRKTNGRREFVLNQAIKVFLNVIEIIILVVIWNSYIKNLMTLISVISAAMTIALREIILNFFSGIHIKLKKPFKVEDRIQVNDIIGDVMSISTLSFDILEVSNKEPHGQSTGIVVTFPNSVVFQEPIKNLSKGFKYIWDEITIPVTIGCNLTKNKQEIYKIVNNIEVIKNIPKKMKNQIKELNTENRIYYNKYDPIIYTKIVNDHIELTVRYLMHPKKARYIESVIWNKVYLAYNEKTIDLYTK